MLDQVFSLATLAKATLSLNANIFNWTAHSAVLREMLITEVHITVCNDTVNFPK